MGKAAQEQLMSRRERLKQEREERILEAAATEFARKGFHQTTIREIAEVADVADGTIYNYFESKGDLLVGILARLADLEDLPRELVHALQDDVPEFLAAMLRHRLGNVRRNQEILQAVLPQVLVDAELQERFYERFVLRVVRLLEQYVATSVELGHVRPIDVPLAVRIVQSMFVGLIMLRILGDETLLTRWDELPEVMATLLFDGLKPADGG